MVQKAGGVQEFSGTFTSPEIKGYGQTATRVAGRLAWKDGVISFPELAMDFYGGRLEGRVLIGTVNGEFDVDARGEELDFARVVPSASGRLSLSLAGRGVFGRDRLPGLFTIKDLMLSPLDKTEARGELQLGAAGGRISLGLKAGLVPGDNPFDGAFDFPLSGELWSGVRQRPHHRPRPHRPVEGRPGPDRLHRGHPGDRGSGPGRRDPGRRRPGHAPAGVRLRRDRLHRPP